MDNPNNNNNKAPTNPSTDQHDLNSILSSNPQSPSNPLPANSPLAENSSLGGGLMSPPISAPPPTNIPSSPTISLYTNPTQTNQPPTPVVESPFVNTNNTEPPSQLTSPASVPTQPAEQITSDFSWPKSPTTGQPASFAPADFSAVQKSPQTPVTGTSPEPTPFSQNETPPTDLSHLVDPNMNDQPETLVTNTSGAEAVAATATTAQVATSSQGIPKWIVILGVVLLLAVAAASAYFILGIGRNSGGPPPASAPATSEQQQIVPPKIATTPVPVASSSAQVATGSAGFGGLNSNSQATSAADLLKQRQGL